MGSSQSMLNILLRSIKEEDFISKMKSCGIPVAVHYPLPIHHQPIFKKLGYVEVSMPSAEGASRRVVSVPMHPYLSKKDQENVVHNFINCTK